MNTKEKLFEVADYLVDAISLEIQLNMPGYRKYPHKIGTMIDNLRSIVSIIEQNKI